MARDKVPFQGLPARICWLGYGERATAGLAFNELVRSGAVSAPIVIGTHRSQARRRTRWPRTQHAARDGTLVQRLGAVPSLGVR